MLSIWHFTIFSSRNTHWWTMSSVFIYWISFCCFTVSLILFTVPNWTCLLLIMLRFRSRLVLPAALPVQAIKIISKSITETVEHCHHAEPATAVRWLKIGLWLEWVLSIQNDDCCICILLSFLLLLCKFLQQSCATVTVYSCQINYSMSILLVFIPVNKPC